MHEQEDPVESCRMRVRDVVELWLAKNPEPRHIRVAGRTYDDFVRSCYLFLLTNALGQGVSSTVFLVSDEDRQQIESFLDRAKSIWDQRRRKEQSEAEERRQAEERRKAEELRRTEERRIAEERRRAEDLRRSEVLRREARQLREERQRREEARRKAEEIAKAEAFRRAEERRENESRQRIERQGQAEVAPWLNEKARRERVFFKHRQAIAHESKLLQAGQCTWAEYYAFILRDRIERSADLLFGSVQQPSYEFLRKNPELLDRLKGNLSFADDRHPGNYQDPYVSAYYTLRYELGYAFEYSQIYGVLLGIMRQNNETAPLDVLSIGSGQGLDYWGLCYALSKQTYWPRIGWHGVDLETWPDHIIEDGLAIYSDGTDVRELLGGMRSLDVKVLMFPKVISELPYDVVSFIASWLENVTLTRDAHYLCFAHTERKSLDPADSKHKGAKDYFRSATESSLDAVKSAALIGAACNGASRQSYNLDTQWYDSNTMSVRSYNVVWADGQTGREWSCPYPYLIYGNGEEGGSDWYVWRDDATFRLDDRLRDAIKGIGSSCCAKYIPSQSWEYGGGITDCDTRRVSCDDSYLCPLHRYPRVKTGRIAYQIVRLVKQPNYDEDIPF